MKNIVWLASYPKSGNTWTRTFLTNLLEQNDDNVINNLVAPIVSSRGIIEEFLMLETSELTNDEIEKYTPAVLREYAKVVNTSPYFMKVHDAYIHTTSGEPLFPAEVSIGAVYIVRNPLDVVASFAHHNADTIDNTIRVMQDEDFCFCNNPKTIKTQMRQKLYSWSKHVQSWQKQKDMPLLVIRYEDIIADPFAAFSKIVQFSGLTASHEEIEQACIDSSFSKLKQQEQQYGFNNKRPGAESFFRKGKMGTWRESLTEKQAQLVIDSHREVMLQLGYINNEGQPLY